VEPAVGAVVCGFCRCSDGENVLNVGCGTGSLSATLGRVTRASKIVGIDPSKGFSEYARTQVVAILTRDDLKDIDPFYGHCLRDRPVIAIDHVRYMGEPVAVVAAANREIAEEDLSLIDVRYKELPCFGNCGGCAK
jgi:CO/xanthine dehydrogenase Mo-binding subunit